MRAKDKVHSSGRWRAQWDYGSRKELTFGTSDARFRNAGNSALKLRYSAANFESATGLYCARAKIPGRQRDTPTFRQGNAPFSRVVRSDVDIRLMDGTVHCNDPTEIEVAAPRRHPPTCGGAAMSAAIACRGRAAAVSIV